MSENKKQVIDLRYRDATSKDVARVMEHVQMECRFRDSVNAEWELGVLQGWTAVSGNWNVMRADGCLLWRKFCEVYDPPIWYKEKPELEAGWFLLDRNEDLQLGDRATVHGNYSEGWVTLEPEFFPNQRDGVWYCRRVETNNPAILDSSRSRDTIPSGWRVLGEDEERLASDAYWSSKFKDWIVVGDEIAAVANSQKWHAIRRMEHQVEYELVGGYIYYLPNGWKIRITEKGFEVV
jgi:hypothetical protein